MELSKKEAKGYKTDVPPQPYVEYAVAYKVGASGPNRGCCSRHLPLTRFLKSFNCVLISSSSNFKHVERVLLLNYSQ